MANIQTDAYKRLYRTVIGDRLGFTVVDDGLVLQVTAPDDTKFLVIGPHENDPEYLQLALLVERPDATDAMAKEAVLRVADRCKVVKAVLFDTVVAFHAEVVNAAPDTLPSPDHLTATLPRLFQLLRHGCRVFHEELVLAECIEDLSDVDLKWPD